MKFFNTLHAFFTRMASRATSTLYREAWRRLALDTQRAIYEIQDVERKNGIHDGVRVIFDEDLSHTCGECGAELELVRPGKYQCIKCEAARC